MPNKEKKLGKFGRLLQALRSKEAMTLRAFCKKASADPANISRVERGLACPPQDEKVLSRYAETLGIAKGSKQMQEFLDCAAIEAGRIPRDLVQDENLAKMLPIFFRTARGNSPSAEELESLVETLRKHI